MEIKQLNEILSDLQDLRYSKKYKKVHSQVVKELGGEGCEGESGLAYEVYNVGLPDGVMVKLKINTDSYGDNEFINGVEFVKAVAKQVTVYEYEG